MPVESGDSNGNANPRVAAIVIAWNEAEALRLILPAIPHDTADEIIVVDGGSTDGTPEVARSLGARVVQQTRRGYGDACRVGAEATTADVLVFLDGDFADDPTEMSKIAGPVLRGAADLVVGTRNGPGSDPDALPPHQRVGNRVFALLLRLLYHVPLDDVGSFRAIRADTLRSLHMQQMTYGWPVEMIVKAARAGYRIQGVPVRYRRRIGESKVGGTLRGSLVAGYRMLAVIIRGAISRQSSISHESVTEKGRT